MGESRGNSRRHAEAPARRKRRVRRNDTDDGTDTAGAIHLGAGNRAIGELLQHARSPSGEHDVEAASAVPVQRDVFGDLGNAIGNAIGDAFDSRPDEERLDALEDLEDWRRSGLREQDDFVPSSGLGHFDVSLDPSSPSLRITLKVAYDFVDGNPGNVDPGFGPEEFIWTDAERAEFRSQFSTDIAAQWSSQHVFQSTMEYWESLQVPCSVVVVESAEDPHYQLTVDKYPADANMAVSSVCPAGTHHAHVGNTCPANAPGEGWGTGAFDSNDLREEMKRTEIWDSAACEQGSDRLTPTGEATVRNYAFNLIGQPDLKIKLTGRSVSAPVNGESWTPESGVSSPEAAVANMELARSRTEVVAQLLQDEGVQPEQILIRNAGMAGMSPDPSSDRVDIQVSSLETQLPGLHEAGHMFGLGDEYGTTESPVGTGVSAGYQAMLSAHGGPVLVRARDESAMSSGSTVQPWHYTPFLEALKTVSGMNEWSIA